MLGRPHDEAAPTSAHAAELSATGGTVLDRRQLSLRRDQLVSSWERLVAGGAPPTGALESAVLASWRRSAVSVSPEVTAAPVEDPDGAVEKWRATPAATGLRAVEADIRRVADEGDLVAAVTDRSGRIVWTYGGAVMRRRAERVNFVPGGRWDEQSVGTNALALALRSGEPSSVYSAEHYSRAVHGWSCYSVPLLEPGTGDVLGVLDLSTTWDRAHPLAMSAALALGRLVTAALPAGAPGPAVELRVLGGWQVCIGGRPLVLPHRQVEALVLLALHPDGLSLEGLHARLYGDLPVGTATLKAEVSRLRTALGGAVGSRPYRLTTPVGSDVRRVLRALEAGDVETAVATARGPLLPGSESPDIGEWREYVEVALREAVLACGLSGTVARFADAHPYDLQVQQHLADLLPVGDPLALARLHRAAG